MSTAPAVSVRNVERRGIAAVHARVPAARVAAVFAAHLDQVYAASRAGMVALDGQNVFLYGGDGGGEVDVHFGVGVTAPFAGAGAVRYTELPAGTVATATHLGDYGRLGETHAAIVAWCRSNGRALAGPRWEVYGHWSSGDAPPRTDVYYLLAE